jgi:hypothetical protein
MGLALVVVVFHIVEGGKGRLGADRESLAARVIVQLVRVAREDVGFAVLLVRSSVRILLHL